jgi:hypothetical protein
MRQKIDFVDINRLSTFFQVYNSVTTSIDNYDAELEIILFENLENISDYQKSVSG